MEYISVIMFTIIGGQRAVPVMTDGVAKAPPQNHFA
jgi:hypothetical protein